ncbi:MAG: sulfur carrier protein ThiS [Candidatus Dormibacteraeota bacterium]|nr:sulfur carrier protein ThiS [Candidatus Dormibacteraeota bacterium]
MISLRVNGKPIELESPTPLLEYVAMLGVDPRAIAVEVNGQILERDGYEGCTLQDGDTVEIVRMVGGGASLLAREWPFDLSPGVPSLGTAGYSPDLADRLRGGETRREI